MPPPPARRTLLQAAAALAVRRESAPTQVAVWRRERGGATLERAELRERPAGLTLAGRLVGVAEDRPLEVAYEIACDRYGATDRLTITQAHGAETRTLKLVRMGAGWRRNGRPAPQLSGCLDVDLGASPSTNLLPIRRLAGTGGRAFEIRAAWVSFPDLDVQPSRQLYELIGERLWRYRNLDSGFTAEIEVDRFGLPIDYRGVWTRIAALIP